MRRTVPLLVLLCGLAVTAAISALLWRVAEVRDRQRFLHTVELRSKTVDDHLTSYLGLMRATAGLYAATRNAVSREDFHNYVERIGIGDNYPGLFGIGFARRILPGETLQTLQVLMRNQGARDYSVFPTYPRDEYIPVALLEPENRRNLAAIGFDMYSEPVRREAMMRARDSGSAAVTGRVSLVQEVDRQKQAGFLIYLPIYSGGTTPSTPDQRRQWLLGFVFSPFRAGDLFRDLFPGAAEDSVGFEVYAGPIAPENLLYRSGPEDGVPADVSAPVAEPAHERTVELPIAQNIWMLRFYSLPSFRADSALPSVWYVAMGGSVATLLLTYAARREGRAREGERRTGRELLLLNRHLEERVALRTQDLEEASHRLMRESEERQQVEDQLRQAQRIEAVGQLTSGVAHDFNNLLTVIAGNLELLKKPLAGDERALRRLVHMREAAERGSRLTQQLLAFSRKQRLVPRPVDVNASIRGMVPLLQSTIAKAIRIEVRETPDLWPAMADPTQLELMVLNLAINARDAMSGDDNSLTVTCANVVTGAPTRPEEPPAGSYVMISVADTGTGMSEEVQAKAFEPFFTTKSVGKGSGLGLSQVYGVTKQLGGGVRIDSRLGQGTIVRVYLPRASETAVIDRRRGALEAPVKVTVGASVLVVDDDDAVRAVTGSILAEAGYRVTDVGSGPAAMGAVLQGQPFDIAVVDYAMPEMNGLQLAERLAEHRPLLPVLFVTGYADFEAMAGRVDDDRILRKPYEPQELTQRIEALMAEARGTQPATPA